MGSMGLHNDEDDSADHADAEADRSASHLPILPRPYPHVFGYHDFKALAGAKYGTGMLQGSSFLRLLD